MNTSDADISTILNLYKTITVMGLSADATKPSHRIPLFMQSKGYTCIGVNPGDFTDIAGMKTYKSLKDVPFEHRKFVDVFRRPEHIPQVVDEVLAVGGVEVLWLQLGITHPEAEARAEAAGIQVVSNRCLLIEYNRVY
jgi:uncharacterized protein